MEDGKLPWASTRGVGEETRASAWASLSLRLELWRMCQWLNGLDVDLKARESPRVHPVEFHKFSAWVSYGFSSFLWPPKRRMDRIGVNTYALWPPIQGVFAVYAQCSLDRFRSVTTLRKCLLKLSPSWLTLLTLCDPFPLKRMHCCLHHYKYHMFFTRSVPSSLTV